MFVGQIGIETEALDTQSHQRLAALVSKAAGKKWNLISGQEFKATSKWGQIEQSIDYYAQRLRHWVDETHGKESPDE